MTTKEFAFKFGVLHGKFQKLEQLLKKEDIKVNEVDEISALFLECAEYWYQKDVPTEILGGLE